MKSILKSLMLVASFSAIACDVELSPYLNEALEIAKTLPQSNLNELREYENEFWIFDPLVKNTRGGYRYVLHDIAVSYSKIGCWQLAISTVSFIKTQGVKDSALAQISIEYAIAGKFDDALELIKLINTTKGSTLAIAYVSRELYRVGKTEFAKAIRKDAGLDSKTTYPFVYDDAMTLAKMDKHSEAFEFIKARYRRLNVDFLFGRMLTLFWEKGDKESAEKIILFYRDKSPSDNLLSLMANFYAMQGQLDEAENYASEILDPRTRALSFFALAGIESQDSEKFYGVALKIVDDRYQESPGNGQYLVMSMLYEIYKLKGQGESAEYLRKYFDRDHSVANRSSIIIAHTGVIRELLRAKKPNDALIYLDNIGHELEKNEYIRSIVELRAKIALKVPGIEVANHNAAIYRKVILEALKSEYSEKEILNAILDNLPSSFSSGHRRSSGIIIKSELLQVTAMVASHRLGPRTAKRLYAEKNSPLLLSRWLIGISQRDQVGKLKTHYQYNSDIH